jgi:hypothetical protein
MVFKFFFNFSCLLPVYINITDFMRIDFCYRLILSTPQPNSYVETLISNVMLAGSGTFGT